MMLSFKKISNFFLGVFVFATASYSISYENSDKSLVIFLISIALVLRLIVLNRYPSWSILYVLSVIGFLCLHEIFFSIGVVNESFSNVLAGLKYKYTDQSYEKAKLYLIYFLSGTYLGLTQLTEGFKFKKSNRNDHRIFLRHPMIPFIICFVIMLFDKILIYQKSLSVGYVEAIHSASTNSILFTLVDILFPITFSILLLQFTRNKIDKNKLLTFTFLFLLPYGFTFLAGFRGEFIGKLLALLIIFSGLIKISNKFYFLGFTIIIISTLGMEFIRFDDTFNLFSLPLEYYLQAFLYLGNSFTVIPLTIEYQVELFHGWKYFFGSPLGIFSFSETYSSDGINSKAYLAQHLMYIIDQRRFLGGSTIGSSVISEILLITPYLIFPIAFIIIRFTHWIYQRSFYSLFSIYISFNYFENLIFVPRGGYLKFIDKEFFLGLIIICLFYLSLRSFYSKNNYVG